jgi:anti-anti-sigma factor
MEITRHKRGDALELRVTGSLDAYWADHLSNEIQEAVRAGSHRLLLNLSGLGFLSSAGIRVLVMNHQRLASIDGSLKVIQPADAVRSVLTMVGLAKVLIADDEELPEAEDEAPAAETPAPPEPAAARRHFEKDGVSFELFPRAGGGLSCRGTGAAVLANGAVGAADCRTQRFPDTTFGLGIGAFGTSFADAQDRFGEFLAVGGSAAYLPTNTANVPDYLLGSGTLVPELQVLSSLVCEGSFGCIARFDAAEGGGAVGLGTIAAACAEIAESGAAGVVLIAESGGLIGAALRRSPALSERSGEPLAHPEIRRWLTFTSEPAHVRSVAVVVGVVARAESREAAALGPLLRPIGEGLAAHFHAGAFSYRPIRHGEADLKQTVSALFEGEVLEGILHLLHDDRQIAGAGESQFVRGACWIGPVTEVVR